MSSNKEEILDLESELGEIAADQNQAIQEESYPLDIGKLKILSPPTGESPYGEEIILEEATPKQIMAWANWSVPPAVLKNGVEAIISREKDARFLLFSNIMQLHFTGYLYLGSGEHGLKMQRPDTANFIH